MGSSSPCVRGVSTPEKFGHTHARSLDVLNNAVERKKRVGGTWIAEVKIRGRERVHEAVKTINQLEVSDAAHTFPGANGSDSAVRL